MARGKAVRPGPGSYRLLEWVARLGMSGVEPARLVLGISQAAVYSHVARLSQEGLLWRVRLGDGEGGVVAITRAGARLARARGARGAVSARAVAPRSGRHGRAVSWVAASLTLRGLEWLGPAEIRAGSGWRSQRDDGTRHTPDLGLVLADRHRTAIEVELHPKSKDRLAQILGGYRPFRLAKVCSTTALARVVHRTTPSPRPPTTSASTGVLPEPVTALSWPRNGMRVAPYFGGPLRAE